MQGYALGPYAITEIGESIESAFLPLVNMVPGGLSVAVVSHDAGSPAVRLATAGGDYIVADVTPKCRTGVSLCSMLPPSCML